MLRGKTCLDRPYGSLGKVLRCQIWIRQCRFERALATSASRPKADIRLRRTNGRNGPNGDTRTWEQKARRALSGVCQSAKSAKPRNAALLGKYGPGSKVLPVPMRYCRHLEPVSTVVSVIAISYLKIVALRVSARQPAIYAKARRRAVPGSIAINVRRNSSWMSVMCAANVMRSCALMRCGR